jgi:hypothetical protein
MQAASLFSKTLRTTPTGDVYGELLFDALDDSSIISNHRAYHILARHIYKCLCRQQHQQQQQQEQTKTTILAENIVWFQNHYLKEDGEEWKETTRWLTTQKLMPLVEFTAWLEFGHDIVHQEGLINLWEFRNSLVATLVVFILSYSPLEPCHHTIALANAVRLTRSFFDQFGIQGHVIGSRATYDHMKQGWDCIPETRRRLFDVVRLSVASLYHSFRGKSKIVRGFFVRTDGQHVRAKKPPASALEFATTNVFGSDLVERQLPAPLFESEQVVEVLAESKQPERPISAAVQSSIVATTTTAGRKTSIGDIASETSSTSSWEDSSDGAVYESTSETEINEEFAKSQDDICLQSRREIRNDSDAAGSSTPFVATTSSEVASVPAPTTSTATTTTAATSTTTLATAAAITTMTTVTSTATTTTTMAPVAADIQIRPADAKETHPIRILSQNLFSDHVRSIEKAAQHLPLRPAEPVLESKSLATDAPCSSYDRSLVDGQRLALQLPPPKKRTKRNSSAVNVRRQKSKEVICEVETVLGFTEPEECLEFGWRMFRCNAVLKSLDPLFKFGLGEDDFVFFTDDSFTLPSRMIRFATYYRPARHCTPPFPQTGSILLKVICKEYGNMIFERWVE